MTPRITIDDLCFFYASSDEKPVFEHLSFQVSSGQVFCLLGPNGTGKSTLIKCLSGLLRPQQGTILLDGDDLSSLKPSSIAKKVGYVPQSQFSVFPFLVRDVVVMGRAAHLNNISSPKQRDYDIADEAIRTVGIAHIAERPCNNISGGEWQLVLIARALTQQPQILLLDEPTSHLDMGNQMRILEVISGLSRAGLTIIMASHFPDHAFLAAHQAAILKDRQFVAWGNPDEVINQANLQAAYGIDVRILFVADGVGRKICVPLSRAPALPG